MPPMTTRARSGGVPARRGRGSGRGRGNAHAPRSTSREARHTPTRARARSAAPLRGGGTDATEMAALREQIETMKTSLDAANGKVRQLEAEREDRVAAAGAGSTSAGEGRTPAGDTLPAEDATPGAYLDRTRAPSPFPSMAHVINARAKESLAAWRNLPILKCWILIGERPTVANLKMMEMQSLLREKVRVTTGVLEQLNAMSGFRVRSYIAEGDDPHRALGDVHRCRNDSPVPWDRVGRRDHTPGDTPPTVQKRHRLDPRPLPPAPRKNARPRDVQNDGGHG